MGEIPKPLAIAIIVIVLIVAIAIGWYFTMGGGTGGKQIGGPAASRGVPK